jgi:hypothetical protein
MRMKLRFNWPVWLGLLVSVLAFISYMTLFVKFPLTRDFPWANLLLFVMAAALVIVGVRRAFATGATRGRKIAGAIAATLSVAVFAMFVFTIFIFGRMIPASKSAPQVGQKAPQFQLADSNGKTVALAELLNAPMNGRAPKGVLLIFYRGYW